MAAIRNLLALIGLLALVGIGYLVDRYHADITAFAELDPAAKTLYASMWGKLRDSGNSADATVWKYPLADGVSPEDAEQTMNFVANEHNIKAVGELPLSDQVKLMTGKEQRFLKIYQFCNPLTAMRMVDYSDAFSAYLPCRVAMVEDPQGKYALYSLNMDLMIYGGKTLPPDLLDEALKVKEIILDIMKRGSSGEF